MYIVLNRQEIEDIVVSYMMSTLAPAIVVDKVRIKFNCTKDDFSDLSAQVTTEGSARNEEVAENAVHQRRVL